MSLFPWLLLDQELIQQQPRKQAQKDGQWILVFVRKFNSKRKNNEKASRYKISDQSTRPQKYFQLFFLYLNSALLGMGVANDRTGAV